MWLKATEAAPHIRILGGSDMPPKPAQVQEHSLRITMWAVWVCYDLLQLLGTAK